MECHLYLAGISFKDAFTSSPYPKQKIESLVSTLKSEGYDNFMEPLMVLWVFRFSNILGIDHYYGRTEFNDDSQFDGFGDMGRAFSSIYENTLDKRQRLFRICFHSVFS
jgi:hypothetical protein